MIFVFCVRRNTRPGQSPDIFTFEPFSKDFFTHFKVKKYLFLFLRLGFFIFCFFVCLFFVFLGGDFGAIMIYAGDNALAACLFLFGIDEQRMRCFPRQNFIIKNTCMNTCMHSLQICTRILQNTLIGKNYAWKRFCDRFEAFCIQIRN